MRTLRSAYLVDFAASASLIYLSVWLYELGNWASLGAVGVSTTITWAGVLPAGVAGAAPDGAGLFLAKMLQVGLCAGVFALAFVWLRGRSLSLAKLTIAGLFGINAASVFWEALSFTAFMPGLVHEAIYVGLSTGAAALLLRTLGGTARGKPGILPAEIRAGT